MLQKPPEFQPAAGDVSALISEERRRHQPVFFLIPVTFNLIWGERL